jgi:hypothetical protein
MLILAAVIHDDASVPLLIIGAAWALMGCFGIRQGRRMAQSVRLVSGVLMFTFPRKTLSLDVAEVAEIRPTRGDINRFAPILVRSERGDVVRLVPRLQGLIELLAEVRRLNPAIKFGHF